jgi:hypothetical protein
LDAFAGATKMSLSRLTDDEFAVLMIAAQGESMMAIGHWQKPIEHLIELGYLKSRGGDNFNCVITPEGREACKARDREDQVDFMNAAIKVMQAGRPAELEVLPQAKTFDAPKEVVEAAALVYNWMRKNRATQLHGLRLSDE